MYIVQVKSQTALGKNKPRGFASGVYNHSDDLGDIAYPSFEPMLACLLSGISKILVVIPNGPQHDAISKDRQSLLQVNILQ